MEFVRRYIDASLLMSVIQLPETLKKGKLEIIVLPAEEHSEKIDRSAEVEAAVNSLIGAIPDEHRVLSDYREERLRKYETVD